MINMIRFIFANLSQSVIQRTNYVANGGAAWRREPPPMLYAIGASAPHNSPWNTVQGRTGQATIPAGGSVMITYTAFLNGGLTATSTITALAGPGGVPTLSFVNSGAVGFTHRTTMSGQDFDIALNFK